MDIIANRQSIRMKKIMQVKESITKAQLEGKEIEYKAVVMAVMANLGLSNRTAREYVDVAFYELGMEKK